MVSGHPDVRDPLWKVRSLIPRSLFSFLICFLVIRTPFAPNQSDSEAAAMGGDVNNVNMLNNDDVQNIHRQKMYEKIITYKDQLVFERRKHRSSSLIAAPSSDSLGDGWREPSDRKSVV